VLGAWAVQAVFAALLVVAALRMESLLGTPLAASDMVALVVALLLVNRFIDSLLDVAGYADALRGAR
jgi:ATP-binding cassette subfamily B protein